MPLSLFPIQTAQLSSHSLTSTIPPYHPLTSQRPSNPLIDPPYSPRAHIVIVTSSPPGHDNRTNPSTQWYSNPPAAAAATRRAHQSRSLKHIARYAVAYAITRDAVGVAKRKARRESMSGVVNDSTAVPKQHVQEPRCWKTAMWKRMRGSSGLRCSIKLYVHHVCEGGHGETCHTTISRARENVSDAHV